MVAVTELVGRLNIVKLLDATTVRPKPVTVVTMEFYAHASSRASRSGL